MVRSSRYVSVEVWLRDLRASFYLTEYVHYGVNKVGYLISRDARATLLVRIPTVKVRYSTLG